MPFESIYPVLLDRAIDHEALVLLAQRQHLDDDPAVKRQIDAATARVLEAVVLERIEAPSNMPFGEIYSMLLDPMIDHENLVRQARRGKLDNDPAVRRQIDATTARILEDALLQHSGVPAVTEAAIQARYARDFANQPAVETEEVRARHILVRSEAEAKRLIDELNKGADFATLVQSFSEDPDRVDGGDTGFIRRGQVIPQVGAKPVLSLEPNQISQPPGHAILPPAPVVSQEGADLVFSLKPNEVAQTPIHNAFGWHVVQVLERRRIPPKTSAQIHDEIRQQLRIEAMEPLVAKARDGLVVQKFNLNGTPMAE
jgi:peptidyl-prolyl cis-trans isomerase C